MSDFSHIMLVDMNSFFASVEQQANPSLRGRPVGVCASLHETSCLIAASKEAKLLGITTGTLAYQAKQICPKIVLLPAEPEKYREVNRQINRIFFDYTNQVESYSIDESFLEIINDPPSSRFQRAGKLKIINVLQIGAEIKRRIKDEVGEWLTCSVGISSNKFLAKLAADLEKPDGLTFLWRDQLPEVYRSKKLTDLWGISHGWERRLARMGITSPLDLLDYPRPSKMGGARPKGAALGNLMAQFGKPGYWLWVRVNGLERDVIAFNGSAARIDERQTVSESLDSTIERNAPRRRITPDGSQKSFGNSWVLNFRTTDKEKLQPVILRLAEKAARRMRAAGLVAHGFYLFIRIKNGEHVGQSKQLHKSINTGSELFEQAMILWQHWQLPAEAMHVAVGFTHLAPQVNQLSLFASDQEPRLLKCLDGINDKYGEFTIRSGIITKSQDYAPDSIAFGR